MGESFVDVSYRGLELGRRLKLRDVLPEAGYLEIPMPMPVGTKVELVTDDGVRIGALVTSVHEQVAGGDAIPGMRVRPALDGAAGAWWKTRVDAAAVAASADAEARHAQARADAEAAARTLAESRAAADAAAKAATDAAAKAETDAKAAAEVDAKAAAIADAKVAAEADAARTEEKAKGRNGKGKRARSEPGAGTSSPNEERPTSGPRPTVVMSTEAVEAALAAAEGDAADAEPSGPVGGRTTVMDAIDISMITGEAPADVGIGDGDEDSVEMTIEDGEGDTDGEKSGKTAVAGNGKPKTRVKRRKKK